MRGLIFLAIALAIFLPFNWITIRQLLRFHPERKRLTIGFGIFGNLMWPFFLTLQNFTPFSRVSRAILGPPWFAWTSFTIIYTAFVLLLLVAWLPFRRRTTFARFGARPSAALLAVLAAGAVVGFYQAIVPLRVERVQVPIAGLPESAVGTKLVLMGDLHVGVFTRHSRLEKIFTTARELNPHAVLIAGDLIDDDPHFVPKLLRGVQFVPDTIPVFAVLGNHEIYGDPFKVIAQLRGSKLRLLVNEGVSLRGLWIAGLSDPAAGQRDVPALKPDLDRALGGAPAGSLPVVLSHQPKNFEDFVKRRIPLTLCAHTHGGQLGFRPLGFSLAGVFLPYDMGLYHRHGSWLYINTGTGYWLVPFRLGMTPEITLIELVAGA